MRKAIIGGTVIYGIVDEEKRNIRQQTVETTFGNVKVDILETEDCELIFLARHGKSHGVPPHLINYRANMMALKKLEVDEIYATCAVGSMNETMGIGDVVLMKDFIDFTKTRLATYYDGKDGVKHVDMTNPYCPHLRELFQKSASSYGINLKGDAVYICTEGPRFETAAEIQMYQRLGGDVVGMTNVPECVLAKELGMCYAAVGLISNWCTGIKAGEMVFHDIAVALESNRDRITKVLIELLLRDQDKKHCKCSKSLISL